MKKVIFIDETEIKNKRVLLRVDFNVSLNPNFTIANDERIRQTLPTINYLLPKNNRLILVSHLGRPKQYEEALSLKIIVNQLKKYLPQTEISLVKTIEEIHFKNEPIVVLENIRFFPEEKNYSTLFAKKLASVADVYVNDAFGVCHRTDTSVIGPPLFLPAFGGLLLKKEVTMLDKVIKNPRRPMLAIIGGAKVSTKIGLLEKLSQLVDYLVIGGAMANTFLATKNLSIGKSVYEYDLIEMAHRFLSKAITQKPYILLPKDVLVAKTKESKETQTVKVDKIPPDHSIFDLGPETLAEIGNIIAKARMIVWNGPVGYFENPVFRNGTDFIYYSITQNQKAISIVGGGDTLSAISKKEYLNKITHLSTGGGAMLEYIEKSTLPGIEALKKSINHSQ
ncbi:MAG: phosphoglycerate kinase [Patescibacteria group bacterium]|nr:phosphoglycerate kinase [Patescibacteria group bacterium]